MVKRLTYTYFKKHLSKLFKKRIPQILNFRCVHKYHRRFDPGLQRAPGFELARIEKALNGLHGLDEQILIVRLQQLV